MSESNPPPPPTLPVDTIYLFSQGCESSDFNLISDFLALHKTPLSDFQCSMNASKSSSFQGFQIISDFFSQALSHPCLQEA